MKNHKNAYNNLIFKLKTCVDTYAFGGGAAIAAGGGALKKIILKTQRIYP